jgi:hypothetical protein
MGSSELLETQNLDSVMFYEVETSCVLRVLS